MAYSKKTWIDRVSQYPNRRTITENGSSKTVTVTRNEGTVTTTGDAFDASTMNDLETRIDNGIANAFNPINWLSTITPTITRDLCGNTSNTSETASSSNISLTISYSGNRCLYHLTPQIDVTNYKLMLIFGSMDNNYGLMTTTLGVNLNNSYYTTYTEGNYETCSTMTKVDTFCLPILLTNMSGNKYLNLMAYRGTEVSSYTSHIAINKIILI